MRDLCGGGRGEHGVISVWERSGRGNGEGVRKECSRPNI